MNDASARWMMHLQDELCICKMNDASVRRTMQQYSVMRCDRLGRPAGGVCVLIPRDLRCHRVNLSHNLELLLHNSGTELVCLDLFMSRVKYRFINVYRPPNLTTVQVVALTKLLSDLSDPSCTCIILGDFNLPKINWLKSKTVFDGIHNVIFDCMSSLGMTQFITDVTRISNSGTANILDLVFSNDPLSINVNATLPPLSTSDHNIIEFEVFFPPNQSSLDAPGLSVSHETVIPSAIFDDMSLTIYDWSKADFSAIVLNLTLINPRGLLQPPCSFSPVSFSRIFFPQNVSR